MSGAYYNSLQEALTYYTNMPGNHTREIAAINQALTSGMGKPESAGGVWLAAEYKRIQKMSPRNRAVFNAIKKLKADPSYHDRRIEQLEAALNPPPRNGNPNANANANALKRRRTMAANRLAANQSNANQSNANRSGNGNGIRRVTRNRNRNSIPKVGSPLAANARRQLEMGGLH
jgi:hypothetical protein